MHTGICLFIQKGKTGKDEDIYTRFQAAGGL